MEISTIISVIQNVAHTLFSFVQLVFIEIIPVFAVFIASLLSRIFCSIGSFVAGEPKSCASASRDSTATESCASPQEEFDEDHDGTAAPNDVFSSDEITPSPFDDDTWASKERYENERQMSVLTRNWEEASTDGWERSPPSTKDREMRGEVAVRDLSSRKDNPAISLVEHPSDLPESLDYVERSPADNLQKRSLPPSLSMVKRTLRESSEKVSPELEPQETPAGGALRRRTHQEGAEVATAAAAKASRSQSAKSPTSCSATGSATTKFHKYLSMD